MFHGSLITLFTSAAIKIFSNVFLGDLRETATSDAQVMCISIASILKCIVRYCKFGDMVGSNKVCIHSTTDTLMVSSLIQNIQRNQYRYVFGRK